MNKFLNMQMIMFGEYAGIKPETDIILKLLTELKDYGFIPGTVDFPTLNVKTGRMVAENRIQLISPDRTWTIAILNDRITFNYTFQDSTKVYSSINDLVKLAKAYVEKVFSVFPESFGNRLAVNCQSTISEFTLDDMKQLCDRFTTSFKVFDDSDYAEWSTRFNARGNFILNESDTEECNRIIEMAKVEQLDLSRMPPETQHNIIFTIDVNTLAKNIIPRFKYNDLLTFSSYAMNFINDFSNEIEGSSK